MTVLLHGTRRPFRPGGLLLPRSQHGGAGTTAPLVPGRVQPADAPSWVYCTTSLELAWIYAWHAPGRGRPRVLQLGGVGDLEPDPEHGPDAEAYRCRWASVAGVLLEPAVDEAAARSGWILP